VTSRRSLFLFVGVLVSLSFSWSYLDLGWKRNFIALLTVNSIESGDYKRLNEAERKLNSLNYPFCNQSWFLGLVYKSLNQPEKRDQAWVMALNCSPTYINLIQKVAPENKALAELVVQKYPDLAEAWFWLAEVESEESPSQAVKYYGQVIKLQPHNSKAWMKLGKALSAMEIQVALHLYEQLELANLANDNDQIIKAELKFIMATILTESQPNLAISYYQEGLKLKPLDGVRWYELGDLLATINPTGALEAYLQSCYQGDPGSHGCYGAGQMAEVIGDTHLAIQYYRRSNWVVAQQRAEHLEKLLP
jgi:tetratricopeptide (TPR) repeat protein